MKQIRSDKTCLVSLLLSVLVLAGGTTAYGQALGANRGDNASAGGRRSIKGQIYFTAGEVRLERFKVRLENPDVGIVTTVTDADGQFTFNGVAAGSYNITVEGSGEFETARENVYIEGTSSGPVVMVPIYLRRKPSADPALASVPKAALDAYLKGLEEGRKGESKKAIEHFKAALSAYQAFPAAYNDLGVEYLKSGELAKAEEVLGSALKLRPYDFDANLNLGIVLLQGKHFEEAQRNLQIASEQRKTAATPHLYLGIALISLKQMKQAQQELETTISLPGGNSLAQAHRYLGGIYWGNREYKRAADELEVYLQLSPKTADAERTRQAVKELRQKQ